MQVTIEYHGFTGTGRNVTEAKRQAGEEIRKAFAGSYTPELFSWRGESAVMWREPSGWTYRFVRSNGQMRDDGPMYGSSGEDRTELRDILKYHLAQSGWTHADGMTVPEILPNRLHKEFAYWARFQLMYRWATEHGATDTQAHHWAGQMPLEGTPEIPPHPLFA